MKIDKLDLHKTSHSSGTSSANSKSILSGGGEPVGSLTTEKLVLDGDSVSEDAGILRKSSRYMYELPDSLIADQPASQRGCSKLLVLDRSSGALTDGAYQDVTKYLIAGDVLVLNDTSVIKARLNAKKANGAMRELIILEGHGSDDDWYRHKVLYRRKLVAGDILHVGSANLVIEEIQGDGVALVKSSHNLLDLAERYGEVPLPPYMHRDATSLDTERYQTVWAKQNGSVAAPTASLNMTDEIISTLRKNGVIVVYLTLHVGLGTFLPIRTDDLEKHHMHKEYFEIPASTAGAIQAAKVSGNKVVALGTTVARTLEYSADALNGEPEDLSGEADIFIYPGYEFKVIDTLLTNFHAPKSTVLMLTAAFAGWDKLLPAYVHATQNGYRFLSYGDSMLIL